MPKPHERRAANTYPYFKVARWSEFVFAWSDLKHTFATEEAAVAFANGLGPGQYRVSTVRENGRSDGALFEVTPSTPQHST